MTVERTDAWMRHSRYAHRITLALLFLTTLFFKDTAARELIMVACLALLAVHIEFKECMLQRTIAFNRKVERELLEFRNADFLRRDDSDATPPSPQTYN
jgi:hypothetical protein